MQSWSYIRSAKFVLYKLRENQGKFNRIKKIDIHGMPNSREETETSCQNGSLMRHFGTCSCNEIRATFVPFAKNCRGEDIFIMEKSARNVRVIGLYETQTATCRLPSFSLGQWEAKWPRKIIYLEKMHVRFKRVSSDVNASMPQLINSRNMKKYMLSHSRELLRNFSIVFMKYA